MKPLAILMVLLLGASASAEDRVDIRYGSANYARRDCYPKAGLLLDLPQTSVYLKGDLNQGQGDFESGAPANGCAYCPTGMSCTCQGTSKLEKETTKIYRSNTSVKATSDSGGNYTGLGRSYAFQPNKGYQITFWYRGDVGGEDIYLSVYDNLNSQYYNFSTKAWQAGSSSPSWTDITVSWQMAHLYLVNDFLTRNAAVTIARNGSSQTWYLDDFKVREATYATPYSSRSNQFLTVKEDPTFDQVWHQMWAQPGSWGAALDGADELFHCSHTNCPWATTTDLRGMTIAVEYTLNTSTPGRAYAAKHVGGGEAWVMYANTPEQLVRFYICKDNGVNCSTTSVIDSVLSVPQVAVGSWEQVTDGASLQNVYLNFGTAHSIATAVAPINPSTADFTLGGFGMTGIGFYYYLPGTLRRAAYYNRRLSFEPEVVRWMHPYYPAPTAYGPGFPGMYPTACTQAASPASCSYDQCASQAPHTCFAEPTGSLAVFSGGTELLPQNSFENPTGEDSSPSFPGWSGAVQGTGAARSAYRADTKHGQVAWRCKTTDTNSYCWQLSSCVAASPSTSYFTYAGTKTIAGRPKVTLWRGEYASGDCTGTPAWSKAYEQYITNGAWSYTAAAAFTTGAGTNSFSYEVDVGSPGLSDPSEILVDTLSVKQGKFWTPWIANGAGTISYNARDYRAHNPLSDPLPSGAYPFTSGFCVADWVYTDWAGNDNENHYVISSPDSSGGANSWYILKTNSNTPQFTVWDSSAVAKAVYGWPALDNTSWTAGNWKYIEACTSNTGTLVARHFNVANATWYPWSSTTGSGTGIQNGQSSSIRFGQGTGIYMSGFKSAVCIAPYKASYTLCDFNGGTPPKKPY
jgi:hypothetical protein